MRTANTPSGQTTAGTGATRTAAKRRLPTPRGYQDNAVTSIVHALTEGGRGTAVLACGTGKTLVAAHATVQLVPAGLVVVACPSLALVAQTMRVWRTAGIPDAVMAVCSDATVADIDTYTTRMRCPVTTNQQQIAAWLRDTSEARLRLVLVTHKSAPVLGGGLHAAHQQADLLVVDEAHRTAGTRTKQAAAVHDDAQLPAQRRLYMTATPRVMAADGRAGSGLSMDDPDIYGPRLFTYPFAAAISHGWLDDYRVVVLGVTRREVQDLLQAAAGGDAVLEPGGASLPTMVAQAALIKAAAQYRLRRILVFTNRIQESQEFAATLGDMLHLLPEPDRPKGALTTVHIDGGHDIAHRQQALDLLVDPPQDGWTVVCNPGCLSEGIDVPAVDAVVFARRKEAEIDIVQAVGRALRRNPKGSGIATILVPVLLDDHDRTTADGTDTAANDRWATICQVVRALRAHDGDLGIQLDQQRARTAVRTSPGTAGASLPPQVLLQLPDGYDLPDVLAHIAVRILDGTTDPWWNKFGQVRAYHTEHGRLPGADQPALQTWQLRQRQHKPTLDAEQTAALESIGYQWAPRAARRERTMAATQQFHAEHGHLDVPFGHRIDGIDLYAHLNHQRRLDKDGKLPADVKAELTRMGLPLQARPIVTWPDAYQLAAAFHTEHGHLRVPRGTTVDDFDLYAWVCLQRQLHRTSQLGYELRRRAGVRQTRRTPQTQTRPRRRRRQALPLAHHPTRPIPRRQPPATPRRPAHQHRHATAIAPQPKTA